MQFACENIVLHGDHHKDESFRVTVIFVDQMSLCGRNRGNVEFSTFLEMMKMIKNISKIAKDIAFS